LDNDINNILIVCLVLLVVIIVFIRVALKVRKYGGSLTTVMYGATDEFYNKDKKNAIEYVVEQKAGKKTNQQNSGELDN
jgi:hypothetical protein